ncbi:uncharacterized protein LOC120281142 [Dioscorea cayenensis subsp. rotundata]|uniref:Uncharacterized protein LOC120281142 n=1 Tax=Dioscorea cayennensis subsp. rotundata TaxID=55577 RepID=A0AB40CYR1_DIOCR|nr:uncharacterized protein LOC120281142 [Dioscorea cayenensis subsp. rotundata]
MVNYVDMERYFTPKPKGNELRTHVSSETRVITQKIICAEFNPNDIIADPGLRQLIEEFDVGIRDQVRREYLLKGSCQPFRYNFPKKLQGKEMRCFQEVWFLNFDWLEYSVAKDKAYCFYCYLFKQDRSEKGGSDIFTKRGYSNWRKALEAFNQHVGPVNSAHNDARRHCEDFKNQRQSVSYVLVSHGRQMEIDYRSRLTSVLDVVRILLVQGLAFCGHDESSSSKNRGNFLEIFNWYAKKLVNACATETTLAIINEIGDRNFSLIVDESQDKSVKEQMAVILRFVNKQGQVVERFFAIQHDGTIADQKVLGITNELSNALQQKDQDIVNAMALIDTVIDHIQDLRDNRWDELLEEVGSFCAKMCIPVPNMKDTIPVREMNSRFSEITTEVLTCISCLHPRDSFYRFHHGKLLRLAEIYSYDFSVQDLHLLKEQLHTYIQDVRRSSDFVECHDLASLAVKLVETRKHLVFPLVYRLIELGLILPVATTSVGKAFSAMNIIKTELRNKIGDEWLNDMMICYIERQVFETIDDEAILLRFQNMQSRRIQLPPRRDSH